MGERVRNGIFWGCLVLMALFVLIAVVTRAAWPQRSAIGAAVVMATSGVVEARMIYLRRKKRRQVRSALGIQEGDTDHG